MLVNFKTLPNDSRIWIYQSDRILTDQEVQQCLIQTENFINDWTAHQADLKASVQILYNHFIVIAVDRNYNEASGCSIDKKVNFIKQLGTSIHVDFFNRMQIAYLAGEIIQLTDMHKFAEEVKSGKLSNDIIMFNNLVTTIKQYNEEWKTPVKNSWMQPLVS